ncbi:MAG: serine hydrolase domain-containing protein [Congregibacter sp.]
MPGSTHAMVRLSGLLAALWVGIVSAADTGVPTAASDPVMASNLKAMMGRPGVLQLDWRQPKETVNGTEDGADDARAAAAFPVDPNAFPSAAALSEAQAYSDAHSGGGLLVWYDGKLVLEHFVDGTDAQTPFSAFSMHKSLLGLTLVAAVEDGILGGLDSAVGDYIPEWRDDPRGAITLRQLLQQVSGLEHIAMSSGDPRAAALALSSAVSATALSYQLVGEPGAEFNYNNVNAQVAGIALENALAARGQRYAEYLSQRLWRPLGNHDAALWQESSGGSPRFYAGLEAGLGDWLRVGVMLAEGGVAGDTQLLSANSLEAFAAASEVNPAYGLNVWRGADWNPQRRYGPTTPLTVKHGEPYLASDLLYFDGFGGQRVYVVPSQRLVIARFGEVDLGFDDAVLPNILLRAILDARIAEGHAQYQNETADTIYAERFQQLQRDAGNGRGLASYDPLIPLPGASSYHPLARGEAAWLDAPTRAWLEELGQTSNSEAIMVWKDGEIVYDAYFGNGGDTELVVSRSLSKPLSVIAVGRALEEGYIKSLDEPASQYLHEWRGTDRESITLRHLLQMRSGLLQQGSAMEAENVLNRAYLHPYHEEVIIHEYPLVNEPGTRYDYSNANSELIAPIIERATGSRYEVWLAKQVLGPLGALGGDIWVNRIGGTAHSGCCARLPAETYLRLAVLYANDGVWEGERLLPAGYVAEVTTATEYNPHTGMGLYVAGPYIEMRGAANPDVSFGKTKHGEVYLDKDLYLFDGNGNQVVYIVPRHGLIALRVGSRPPKERPWDNSAMPNTLLRALRDNTGATLIPQADPR